MPRLIWFSEQSQNPHNSLRLHVFQYIFIMSKAECDMHLAHPAKGGDMKSSSKAFFPVNLLLTAIALGYVVLFCTACPPEEEIITITDDFDDNILDPTLWPVISYGEPWDVAEKNQKLEL